MAENDKLVAYQPVVIREVLEGVVENAKGLEGLFDRILTVVEDIQSQIHRVIDVIEKKNGK